MILLDTHAWIWWTSDPSQLGREARRRLEHEARRGTLLISAISCWEVAKLVAKGRLGLTMDVEVWLRKAFALPAVRLAELTPDIAVLSTRLPGRPPSDPADQILLATAIDRSVALVSRDAWMRQYGHVPILW